MQEICVLYDAIRTCEDDVAVHAIARGKFEAVWHKHGGHHGTRKSFSVNPTGRP